MKRDYIKRPLQTIYADATIDYRVTELYRQLRRRPGEVLLSDEISHFLYKPVLWQVYSKTTTVKANEAQSG